MLSIRLFGTPTFHLENQVISHLVTGRAAALLIYLAVTGQPHARAQLADLLWENLPEQQAKANLRYRLSDLRKVVGDYVVATNETVAFNQALPHWVDTTVFTTFMPNATLDPSEPDILQDLLKLYTGTFLASFQIEEAPVFTHWQEVYARHLHDLLVKGIQLRIQQHMAQGSYAEGLVLNHDLLRLEPWREEAHRQRMVLLAHSGQRSAALQQYTLCCQVLAEELDVPPMPQTTALYEEIKSGQWFTAHQANGHALPVAIMPFPADLPTHRQNGTGPAAPQPAAPAAASPQFDLGTMPDTAHFYGRQAELATLHSWIGQEHSRLVSLFGLSGQGKTALAAAFVHDVIEDEQNPNHGLTQVIWRSLAETPPCTEILQGWLHALAPSTGEARSLSFDQLVTRLFAILQTRRCLLVLDGVEAILANPTLVDDEGTETYRPGCAAYATLFQLFFQRRHRSCLLLTSRIRPGVLTHLDERNGAFHCLEVGGLSVAAGAALLGAHGIVGVPTIHQQLHQCYAGSPQLLGRAANLIHELFDGDGAAFLQEGLCFLGETGSALAQLWHQLSPLEQQVLQRLAQASQPLTSQLLCAQLTPAPAKRAYFQALQRLQRTFLIQQVASQLKLSDLLAAYLAEHACACATTH